MRFSRHGAVPGLTHHGSFGDGPDAAGFMAGQEGYEPTALGDSIATMQRVAQNRQYRTALESQYGSPEDAHQAGLEGAQSAYSNATGGWDAFFGALQNKQQEAAQHGLRFRANLGSLDLPAAPTSPAISGLYSALRSR